jgi:L-lactate dehydrogenase complex protein LldG
MSAREEILGRLRGTLASEGDDAARKKSVAKRLAEAPTGVIPKRGQLDRAGRIDLFCEMAQRVQTTVDRVASASQVPRVIADYLRSQNLPASVRMGKDDRLRDMPWDDAANLEILFGVSDGGDAVAVAHADAGVAESGTLVLTSGADNPTSNNFLPDTHIVVLQANDIDGDYENLMARLRAVHGKGQLPRTVNMVTGPSRSADIEQTLLLGAHGPRSLHVIVVET